MLAMAKLETDRSPTLAVIFASFPPKEIKVQPAFSFTPRLVCLGLGWIVPAAERCYHLVALQ